MDSEKQSKDDLVWIRAKMTALRLFALMKVLFIPMFEVIRGVLVGTFGQTAAFLCLSGAAIPYVLHAIGTDVELFQKVNLLALYPKTTWLIRIYRISILIFPFWIWGFIKWLKSEIRKRKIKEALETAGIKTRLGKIPTLISDAPVTPETSVMTLYKNGTDLNAFKNGKAIIESSARIFVDVFRDNIVEGKIEILYGLKKLEDLIVYEDCAPEIAPNSLLIGKGRGRYHYTNLETHPHLLIAGVSGAGKSTFLRSIITTLIRENEDYRLYVVDLKGGMEFKPLLEGVSRTTVRAKTNEAITTLKELNERLDSRMKFLEKNRHTDIAQYFKKAPLEERIEKTPEIAFREVVIVDECSDLFLRGPHITQEDMKTSREVLSRISRMGRAVGIHLILATQRPDAAAIDSQVKSNLSGVIAFRAANLATSMTILENARATELPAEIKRRAIWKADGEYFEVQTPHLSVERATSLLSQFKSELIAADRVTTSIQSEKPKKDLEDDYGM